MLRLDGTPDSRDGLHSNDSRHLYSLLMYATQTGLTGKEHPLTDLVQLIIMGNFFSVLQQSLSREGLHAI